MKWLFYYVLINWKRKERKMNLLIKIKGTPAYFGFIMIIAIESVTLHFCLLAGVP
jgi:hypothetical protein